MSTEFGFFNSVNNDRLYNAETFNSYFEGLIGSNGVFANVGESLRVEAAGGLAVNVKEGKAIVHNHWFKVTATETITLAAAHNLLSRHDAIVLRWDNSTRQVSIEVIKGTPTSAATLPQPIRATTIYDIVLAYVRVKANASEITTADIIDRRMNTDECGYITGLIEQVDITDLHEQYEARFNELEASMQEWQAQQQAQFEAWYEALSSELNVNTYIEQYKQSANTTEDQASFTLNSDYAAGDILEVLLNNIVLLEDVDYTISGNVITFANGMRAGNIITAKWYKSRIGWN